MKKAFLLGAAAAALTLTACQNTTHRVDRFDNVRIQQMTANNVTRSWFEKVVVCLNARREIRADGSSVITSSSSNTRRFPTSRWLPASRSPCWWMVPGTRSPPPIRPRPS